jgi:hypothetical protein
VLAASGDTIITASRAGNRIRATIYRTYRLAAEYAEPGLAHVGVA